MRLLSLTLRILFATAWLLAGPTLAGTKLDLSPYLGNLPQEGDFKVFSRSTGGERTVTVLELEPWKKKGWKARFSSEMTGAGEGFDGMVTSEEYLIPGKQLLSGSEFYDSGLYAAGVGLVRADIDLEFYVDGLLEDAQVWSEELSSGIVEGVPFP